MNAPTLPEIVAAWEHRGRTQIGDPHVVTFGVALIQELAKGHPVTPHRAAELTDTYTEAEIKEQFAKAADKGIELDATGALTGNALTLKPTRHRYQTDGVDLYAWCSLDTLFLPALIGSNALVTSTDPVTGDQIRLTVSPNGVIDYTPSTARLSIVVPGTTPSCSTDGHTGPTSATCSQMHFFTTPETAAAWANDHPGVEIVTVDQAEQVAAALAATTCSDCC